MDNTEMIKKALTEKASEYLGQPFTPTDFLLNDDGSMYLVQGTILRHAVHANVEVSIRKETMAPCYWRITDESIPMLSERVGTIQLSENICVTDPGYDRDVWCMSQLNDVKPGTWEVFASIDEIDCWGKRVYILELYHQELTAKQKKCLPWVPKADLGVDSGQMSVFDDAFFRRKGGSIDAFKADADLAESFYQECCDLSLDDVGIFYTDGRAVGVVCSSGCGDGSYPLSVQEIDRKIVGMRINFM